MHCLAGLDTLTSGEIEAGGQRLAGMSEKELTILRRDHIGFVFQSFNLIPTPHVESEEGMFGMVSAIIAE